MKPIDVDDGVAKVLRDEMQERNGNLEDVYGGQSDGGHVAPSTHYRGQKNYMLFQICWIVRNCLQNSTLQS